MTEDDSTLAASCAIIIGPGRMILHISTLGAEDEDATERTTDILDPEVQQKMILLAGAAMALADGEEPTGVIFASNLTGVVSGAEEPDYDQTHWGLRTGD